MSFFHKREEDKRPSLNLTNPPPSSMEAEKAFIGSILLDPTIAPAACREIESKHFYSPAHRTIFEAIKSVVADNMTVDPLVIIARIETTGGKSAINDEGVYFFTALVETIPTAANWKWYASQIVDTYKLRQAIYHTTEVLRDLYCPLDRTPKEMVARSVDTMLRVAAQIRDKTQLDNVRQFADTFEDLEKRIKFPEQHRPVSTGWQDLNKTLGGWFDSDLIVIAARPSMGKTALAAQTAMASAETGTPTLFVSLEMPRNDIEGRIICSRSGVSHHLARQGKASNGDLEAMRTAARELELARIYFDDRSNQTVQAIASGAKIVEQRYGKCGLIIVDYLQIVEPEDRRMMREQQVTAIAKGLKDLAKELRIPVIALAQLKRSDEKDKDRKPRLSDLRESGGIEAAADVVILLHRDEYYHPGDNAVRGKADFIVAKQRMGPTGSVKMRWDGRAGLFYDLTHRWGPGDDEYEDQVPLFELT